MRPSFHALSAVCLVSICLAITCVAVLPAHAQKLSDVLKRLPGDISFGAEGSDVDMTIFLAPSSPFSNDFMSISMGLLRKSYVASHKASMNIRLVMEHPADKPVISLLNCITDQKERLKLLQYIMFTQEKWRVMDNPVPAFIPLMEHYGLNVDALLLCAHTLDNLDAVKARTDFAWRHGRLDETPFIIYDTWVEYMKGRTFNFSAQGEKFKGYHVKITVDELLQQARP